ALATARKGSVAVHPELTIAFGTRSAVRLHREYKEEWASELLDSGVSPYEGGILATREIFERYPFFEAPDAGFGFPDWHWTAHTLAQGISHIIAPATWHYVRKQPP